VDAPDLTVTITDLARAGYCARGARRWFEGNGLDFRAFLKDGIPASALLATGDAMAERAVAKARERGRG
jgi:DNA-binding LacI/PurR family transcriptional regulator